MLVRLLLLLATFVIPTMAWGATASLNVAISVNDAEIPGPSAALFNNPYYTCVRNFYVATNGNDSNNGTSPSTPWLTIQNADTSSRVGGDCVNVAPGNYAFFDGDFAHGGTIASPTGYVTYRCTAPGFTVGNPTGGCVITDGVKAVCSGAQVGCSSFYPSYLIFDGFTFIAPTENTFGTAFTCSSGAASPVAPGCHHWVIVNNVIVGYGQGGIQMNQSEYEFILHNLLYNNSSAPNCDSSAQGSGISFAIAAPVSGYTQTADDIGPTPKMGIYGNTNPNPFHQFVEWNVTYNNHMTGCGLGGSTDGNGIILDTFNWANQGGVDYPYRSLVAFNVVYNNGGGGVHIFGSSHATVANNSVFNNYLDTDNTGTARGNIDGADPGGTTVFVNNASYMILGSGILTNNTPFLVGGNNSVYYNGGTGCGLTVDGVADCGGNNIDYLKNFVGTPGQENAIYDTNPAWDCSANKCMTDPKWTNVDSTGGNTGSAGTMSTPPVGVNFGLQAGSPAIGFGQTRTYLPVQSVDVGACYHTLTTCP